MGTRGKRRIIDNQVENAQNNNAVLLRSASDLRALGRRYDCYDNLALRIENLVQYIPDISLEYVEMDSTLSGSLSKRGGSWLIKVNKYHSLTRQRFTIAHELGHFIYHKDDYEDDGQHEFIDTTFFRGMTSNNFEYTANRFASELLMPEEDVRRLIDNDNIRSISDLALKFGVSSAAMLYRVKELNYKTKE